MKKLRVAFGLDDGLTLTEEHFGDARFFRIYDIYEDGRVELVEDRENRTPEEEEHEEHHGDPKKFKAVIYALRDCDVLAGFRMGPNFLRIRDNSDKVPYITGTRVLREAVAKILLDFDKLWEQLQEKRADRTK